MMTASMMVVMGVVVKIERTVLSELSAVEVDMNSCLIFFYSATVLRVSVI